MNGEIRTYFELEARELVDRLTRGAAQLDGSAPSPENLQSLQRAAHTLKGAAHVVGEAGIAALAHDFEDALAEYVQTPRASVARQLLTLTDEIAAALSASSAALLASASAVPAAAAVLAVAATAGPAEDLLQAADELSSPPRLQPHTPSPQLTRSTVRVDRGETGKLLTQINLGGALAAQMRGPLRRLVQLEGDLIAAGGNAPALQATLATMREELQHDLERLDRQILELHRTASRLNVVSTRSLLLEAGRIVRSTAAAVHREVDCITHGGNDRIDLQIVEALQDALLHLIRNAIVHGVESPSERRRARKPRVATISVSVTRSGSDVILTCSDDGRGIALEPIRQAAVERGLLSAEEAVHALPEALLALLLRPGFSTRRSADALAGRGVGLDAVQDAVNRLHGNLHIASEPGRGSTFSLTAPHTFFALAVLEVTAGGVCYAVPVEAVEQTFRLEAHHKITGQGSRSVLVDRETMPYLVLQNVMPAPALPGLAGGLAPLPGRTVSLTCVVLRTEFGRLALAVDRVESASEILMQPLPTITGATAAIAGAALAPGGQPFLVLHPAALFNTVAGAASQGAAVDPPTFAPGPILVIDDSLTTRMLEQSILEAEGYSVDLAVSAEQGLAMARQKTYSLFLVDVEMPGMNGFDFVRTVQADAELSSIPSILVTSLDSAEDRARGRTAGAVSYVVKGEFNQQVYLDRIRAVIRDAV